jgi:copper chaperone
MTSLTVHCPEIECEGCANAIKRSLGAVGGVQTVEVGVEDKKVTVRYDEAQVSEPALRERLGRAGFPPE